MSVRPLAELIGGDALVELDRAWRAAWSTTDVSLLELCGRRIAMLLGHTPTLDRSQPDQLEALSHWPTSPVFGDGQRAALTLTEQYLIDVAAVTTEHVVALAEQLDGASVIDFVNSLLVIEQRMRLELGLSRVLESR